MNCEFISLRSRTVVALLVTNIAVCLMYGFNFEVEVLRLENTHGSAAYGNMFVPYSLFKILWGLVNSHSLKDDLLHVSAGKGLRGRSDAPEEKEDDKVKMIGTKSK